MASLTRRDLFAKTLTTFFRDGVTVEPPAMGMSFWLRVAGSIDLDAWSERCLRKGLAFTKGREYAFDGASVQTIRFGFASHREQELLEIVQRMAQALLKVLQRIFHQPLDHFMPMPSFQSALAIVEPNDGYCGAKHRTDSMRPSDEQ